MAKFEVTPELAEVIKTTRIQNHVTAKAVSQHIGKSQAYMSKLERAEIKTIEESDLTSIFRFIYGKDEGFQDFLDATIGKVIETADLKKIDEQLWLHNYDTVLRNIPIPEELVDDLNKKIADLNITLDELCFRINSNEALEREIANDPKYPYNEWKAFSEDEKARYHYIKIKVDIQKIKAILNKTNKKSNYITILALAVYIIKIKEFGTRVDISDQENSTIMDSAIDYLNSFKFFSIAEKNKLKKQMQSKAEQDSLLSEFDKINATLLNKLLAEFKFISDIDILKTNEYLQKFVNNLNWDGAFMMKLISIDFKSLDDASFSIKKQLLLEINNIVEKYLELPESERKIEIYD